MGSEMCIRDRLTGAKFPVSSGICTKAPIVVQCSRSKDAEGMSFSIVDGDKQFEVPDADQLTAAISRAQLKALQPADGDSLSPAKKISDQEIRVIARGPELPARTLLFLAAEFLFLAETFLFFVGALDLFFGGWDLFLCRRRRRRALQGSDGAW